MDKSLQEVVNKQINYVRTFNSQFNYVTKLIKQVNDFALSLDDPEALLIYELAIRKSKMWFNLSSQHISVVDKKLDTFRGNYSVNPDLCVEFLMNVARNTFLEEVLVNNPDSTKQLFDYTKYLFDRSNGTATPSVLLHNRELMNIFSEELAKKNSSKYSLLAVKNTLGAFEAHINVIDEFGTPEEKLACLEYMLVSENHFADMLEASKQCKGVFAKWKVNSYAKKYEQFKKTHASDDADISDDDEPLELKK